MNPTFSFRKVYGTASVLATVTALGLIVALFGDGICDAASWAALVIPLIVIVWKIASDRLRSSQSMP